MTTMTTPRPIVDGANWTGRDIASGQGWRHMLDQADIDDLIKMAVDIRPMLDGDPNRLLSIPKHRFQIGAFAHRLQTIYDALRDGLGFALIKGLPVDELTPLDIATIYWGIGQQLGDATPNNPDGDMFGHITDLGKTQDDPNSRGYQTRETMDYHCDQCDLVGLICIRPAKSGGVSKLASSVAMYNELLRRHPDYVDALNQPMYWTKHGEHPEGEQPWYQSPVFNFMQGKLCTSFGPKHIIKGYELPQTPNMTNLQRRAINKAEEIANELRLEMVFESGDMQFANNYVILHTRSEFKDHIDPSRKRLLWRLWLMNDDLRARTNYTRQWQKGVDLGTQQSQLRL